MPTIAETLSNLEMYFSLIQGIDEQKDKIKELSKRDPAKYEAELRRLNGQIRDYRNEMEDVIRVYDSLPERHHNKHIGNLPAFYQSGALADSVFIMTKYPSEADQTGKAEELKKVIEAVTEGIKERGYAPRVASEQVLGRWLWENVELFLCGCARGVAIVEDKYVPELNPNVAMEWGWMVGMGKRVLFLREASFNHKRADWDGLLSSPFDWSNPAPGVKSGLASFLPPRPAK